MASRVSSKASENYDRGCIQLRDGKLDDAVTSFSRAIFLDPKNDDYHHKRADAHLLCGDLSSAIRHYRKALSLRGASAFMCRKVAVVHDVVGQLLLDGHPLHSNAHRHVEARERFADAVTLNAADPIYKAHLAIAEASMRRYPRALAALNDAIVLDPRSADLRVLRARVHDLMGSPGDAVLDVDAALTLAPDHPAALGYRRSRSDRARELGSRATFALFAGDARAALAAVDHAVSLNPSDVELYIKRAIVRRGLGQYEDAARDLATAVRKAGGVHPAAQHQFCLTLNEIGVGLLARGKAADAVVYFDKAVRGNDDVAEFYVNRGHAHSMLGQLQLAKADYHAALERAPRNRDASAKLSAIHAEIARRLFNESEYERAAYEAGLAIEAFPAAPYYALRADCRIAMSNFSDAVEDLARSVELRPVPGSVPARKLAELCPNGLPPRAQRALDRAAAEQLPRNALPPPKSRQQDEHDREKKGLSNLVEIRSRSTAQVDALFDVRPNFAAHKRASTTVSLLVGL